MSKIYDEVYEILVPYSSYLQMSKSTIVEGRVKGFPVEAFVAFTVGVVISSFFKGFFSELGKVAAQKTIDKIKSAAKSKEEFTPRELKELDDLIMYAKSESKSFSNEILKKAYFEGKRELENELKKTGIPSYRIEKVSHKCSIVLQAKIVENEDETNAVDC